MRIGSLFSGTGGLDQGVQSVLGGTVAWHSEINPGACKILAHRYPDVPNHGDITAVDWSAVESVDVLTGGSPCQDLSHAGKRGGMTEGTRSNLWVAMRDAIEQLRPGLVVWENVRGAYSAPADSELESREGYLGVRGDGPVLRALGRVLGDLSELGFDAEWIGLRAADVGAPHGRFRVFVIAWLAEDAHLPTGGQRRVAAPGQAEGGRAWADAGRRGRAPAADPDGDAIRQQPVAVAGRSGPAVAGHARADAAADPAGAERRGPESDGLGARRQRTAEPGERAGFRSGADAWGPYAAAVARWETVLGRPAPPPTELNAKGSHRLSAVAVEWLMGLPVGWVTDVPGLGRNEQLKSLGNGVVPQQCAAALRLLLAPAHTRNGRAA